MKKTILAILVVAVIASLYWMVRSHPIDIAALAAKKETVHRGDLTIPINASGDVEPTRRVDVKSKASGEVIEVGRKAGERVAKGDLLILLKRDDEQRNVDRARADVKRAQATLDKAGHTLTDRKGPSLNAARARVEGIKPQIEMAEFQLNKAETLKEDSNASREEVKRASTNRDQLKAQLASAEAELEAAKTTAIALAEQDVITAEATLANTNATLADAEQHLEETRIVSPIDGMVAVVNTHVGEVIQGGQTTITGGTVLARVAEVDRIYVKTEVDEADIGVVRELAPESARPQLRGGPSDLAPGGAEDSPVPIATGSTVKITVEAFHDEEFYGTIERIYPEPKQASSVVTYIVDVLITSPNRDMLMLGMHADVEFTAKSVQNAVLVRHDAIRRGPNDRELGVYIPTIAVNGKLGEPKFVRCRFGLDNGVFAEVIEGLSEGQEVYIQVPGKTEREQEKESSGK